MAKKETSFSYFDKPDGEDVTEKLWHVMKPTAAAAFALSVMDVMLNSKPKGYMNTLTRVGIVSLPIVGASAAFVVTSNMVASIRKKSDKVNWALGGAAAGALLGASRRSQPMVYNLAIVGAILGYTRKHAHEQGYKLIPDGMESKPHFTLFADGIDLSLTKERAGNYMVIPAGTESSK